MLVLSNYFFGINFMKQANPSHCRVGNRAKGTLISIHSGIVLPSFATK